MTATACWSSRKGCRISNGHIKDHLHGLRLLGFVGLGDPLRSGVVKAVERCREAGIGVRMITGDHPATALAIARQLGLSTNPETVVTGVELAALDCESDEFAENVGRALIYARIEPAQKLAIVRALQKAEEIVAVTGDGVNDGPALRVADIGVAMGRGGTDVARGAADMVLADDNFATIVAGIEEGRVTFLNVRKIVLFMVATGLAEICMFLGALAAGLPMPLTPVQLLWLNLVTNGVQDVTLGFGRGEGDELQQPPRRKLAALLDREAVILMLPGAIVMTAMSVWMLATHLAAGDTTAEARNAVLLMVVLFQNAFLLSVRSLHRPFWRWHPPEWLDVFRHGCCADLAYRSALLPSDAELAWCPASPHDRVLAMPCRSSCSLVGDRGDQMVPSFTCPEHCVMRNRPELRMPPR